MRRLFLALAIVLLSLLLIFGSVAFAAPGTFTSLKNLTAGIVGGTTSNMVTITPKSVDAHNTYVITGVTGTPDSTKRQVEARALSSSSQPESKTVSATGVVNTPRCARNRHLDLF